MVSKWAFPREVAAEQLRREAAARAEADNLARRRAAADHRDRDWAYQSLHSEIVGLGLINWD